MKNPVSYRTVQAERVQRKILLQLRKNTGYCQYHLRYPESKRRAQRSRHTSLSEHPPLENVKEGNTHV